MKKFFQIFAITAIAAGAYFVTASKQEVVDGDQVSVEMNVEMMSIAEASSPGGVDICRCLTEPGSSSWNKKNGAACDRAISNRIGVSDWTRINFNQRPDLNAKWKQLQSSCGQ